jgi:hypothetical protein
VRDRDVPQDDSFYGGHLRACYAVDERGEYVLTTSRGWETERIATAQAIADLHAKLERRRQAALAGEESPLAFHMAARQMTPALLAQNMGISRWRVRRHLRPGVFRRLSQAMLHRYAVCLDVPVETLARVPAAPVRVFLSHPESSETME